MWLKTLSCLQLPVSEGIKNECVEGRRYSHPLIILVQYSVLVVSTCLYSFLNVWLCLFGG